MRPIERGSGPERQSLARGRGPMLLLLGDSLTQQESQRGYTNDFTSTQTTNIGSLLSIHRSEHLTTPAGGAGTLAYTKATHSLTWTAPGGTAGTAQPITRDGIYLLPGSSANTGLYVNVSQTNTDGTSNVPATDKSDTITVTANGFVNYRAGIGPFAWAKALSGSRVYWPADYDSTRRYTWGASGKQTEWAKYAVDNMLAAFGGEIGIVGFKMSTNDLNNLGCTPALIEANLTAIFDKIISSGHTLIIVNNTPRSDTSWDTTSGGYTKAQKVLRTKIINAWFNEYARTRRNVHVVDAFAELADFTSSTDEPLTNMLHDDLHYGTGGAYKIGKKIATLISSIVPPTNAYTTSYADTYDATYNPTGNLLAAGAGVFVTGAGGTQSTGTSGTLAAGWRTARNSGSDITCVNSKETPYDGRNGESQRLVINNSGGATTQEINLDMPSSVIPGWTTNFNVGDTIRGWMKLKVVGTASLRGIMLQIGPTLVSGNYIHSDLQYVSTTYTQLPDGEAFELVLETPDYEIISLSGMGAPNFTLRTAVAAGGGDNTIDVSMAKVFKVA